MFNSIKGVVLLAGLTLLAGCGGGKKANLSERKVNVVATTGMIGDAATVIGGDRVSVVTLMGPGVDPHLYKASEGDVARLSEADIIFYNGLHLEGRMTEILARMQSMTKTVAVAEAIPEEKLLTPSEFKGAHDPHVWFDVGMWIYAVEAVRDAYTGFDPDHAESYMNNAAAYLQKLRELHTYILEKASVIPEKSRVLISAHDAFNYFGRAYGFEVRGLQGISTASEAGTADVQKLAEFIARRRIPAIFVESSVPVRNIEAVQAAVKAKNFDVKIGGELFSDALGDPGSPEGTYPGMVRHNIDTIVNALAQDGE